MKSISIVVLTLGLIFQTGIAQAPNAERKEARKAVKAYVQENIVPALQTQRAKLDKELSSSEQQTLAQLREELKALRNNHKEAGPRLRELRKNGEMPTQEDRDVMRSQAKAHRLLMNRAWAIADAHEATIYRLIDEMSPQMEEWGSEIEKMVGEHKPDFEKLDKGDDELHPPHGEGHRHHGRHGHGKLGKLRKLGQPVFFLLWDGKEMPGKREGRDRVQGRNSERGSLGNRAKVIPNPANGSHELRYKLQIAGQVTVTLLDYTGKPLKTMFSGEASAGQNTINLSTSDLQEGLYFYQIESPDGEQAVRFFVK